ncbi:MAG: YdjY domain-containing protein [Gemmataceae bacterium]
MNARTFLAVVVAASLLGCEPQVKTPDKEKVAPPPVAKTPPPAETEKPVEVKRVPMGKNVEFENRSDKSRRVRIDAEVCFREGPLELLLCRKRSKEHEAVVAADIDARDVHKALLAAGAKAGSPVKYVPKFVPPTGSPIKITIEYAIDGKTVTVPAREWVRNAKTKKTLDSDWVFAGSLFYPNPEGQDKPPLYAANGGDIICVSNFDGAMLDLPIDSSKDNDDLQFEANTDRIPPLGTKVVVILEVVPEKK